MKYGVTFSKVVAGRVRESDIIDYESENPKFGFCWWFWKPTWQTNGGKFKKGQTIDVGVFWLCFYVGLIFWPGMTFSEWIGWNKKKR